MPKNFNQGSLRKRERTALEAVVRRFSATWEQGENPRDIYVLTGKRRICVTVATLGPRMVARPQLRFDRVALRLVRRLRDALNEIIPDGKTMLVTITAPIRMPSKTAADLIEKIRTSLARRLVPSATKDTIHGNEIRVRFVKNDARQASKVIGFVHNPEPEPDGLLDVTRSLIARIGTAAAEPASGDRWLVLVSEDEVSHIESYRHVYSQLSLPNAFKKILMVFAGEKIETLTP